MDIIEGLGLYMKLEDCNSRSPLLANIILFEFFLLDFLSRF